MCQKNLSVVSPSVIKQFAARVNIFRDHYQEYVHVWLSLIITKPDQNDSSTTAIYKFYIGVSRPRKRERGVFIARLPRVFSILNSNWCYVLLVPQWNLRE